MESGSTNQSNSKVRMGTTVVYGLCFGYIASRKKDEIIKSIQRSEFNYSLINVSSYIAIMYRELTIPSDVPAPKLTKAFKTGKLSLTADQINGSGSVIHLHPASYEKAIKARKAGRGVRLDITRREVKKGYKRA
ncbi:unnamed protein product [Phytophthora lilii]|uniref:Unnamed protein product n=1 Tax=Phytophthora lilii TaxID=2077276 RepID=A0A9W6XA56_9STRA|nr:unnamed protein product [Phytophthora lilii]